MLFHIDEAMSWETVRNLQAMKPLMTLIRNIALQAKVTEDIDQAIEDMAEILDGVLQTHDTGKL